jgi:hypothetical protein
MMMRSVFFSSKFYCVNFENTVRISVFGSIFIKVVKISYHNKK